MIPHMISYMIPYMIPYRYVWAYREMLCRSVHDMTKQKYDSKKYSPAAWLPLAKWVREAPEAQKDRRQETLLRFTKADREFWELVAKCLRSMSTAANLPWGRSAVEPNVYLAIPSYEKVTVKYTLGSIFFLCSFTQIIYGWSFLEHNTPCQYITQAWATACAIRNILGKAPHMWLRDFPHDVWVLHRKLHHRFLKFRKVVLHMIPHMISIYDSTYDIHI